MSVPSSTRSKGLTIPGLDADQQDALDVLIAAAVRQGCWSFEFRARQWLAELGWVVTDHRGPDHRGPDVNPAMRRLDKATAELVRRGLVSFEDRRDGRTPRTWVLRPGAIKAAAGVSSNRPS